MKGGILCERSRRDERKLTDSDVSSRARGSEYHYFHWPSDRDRKEPDFKKRKDWLQEPINSNEVDSQRSQLLAIFFDA